jgi:hypothetical protein
MIATQDPYGAKDIKVTSSWDFALSSKPEGHLDLSYTDETSVDTFKQLIRLCLNTAVGSYKSNLQFGASPKGKKTLVTSNGMAQLKSYIYQNITNSNINPNRYALKVEVIPDPISKEAVIIHVQLNIPTGTGNIIPVMVNSIFYDGTQELKTITGFGE